ncbi:MAG: imelysin family protein [Gammaproteobacteria bacterium]|nr:imelysin family protein [Gammaproteobacteria bacterium]MCP5458674.1 imelysin family protein [Gammaproteobacteria bacterium]
MKYPTRPLIVACLCALAWLDLRAAVADDTQILVQTADQQIIPAYHKLAVSTAALQDSAQSFCADPSDDGLTALREAFHAGMDNWESVQYLRFGPVEFLLRGSRFELWPDTRGTVGKHLRQLLSDADPTSLEPMKFARGSVAVQGFSALEVLLFEDQAQAGLFGSNDAGRFRCAVVQAIARNLAEMAAGIEADWVDENQGHRRSFVTAEAGNDFYESARGPMGKLLNNLHTQLQFIGEQKLDRPLGSTLERANGRRAESWLSGRSLRNIQDNLRGLQALYQTAFAPQIADQELAGKIADGFAEALRRLENIPRPLHEAVSDPSARQTVVDLRSQIHDLEELFSGPVPKALDLSLGFNSLDGD